ncbi:hypothetical protein Droror1_Dr00011682 [Drosera rotundifolia]
MYVTTKEQPAGELNEKKDAEAVSKQNEVHEKQSIHKKEEPKKQPTCKTSERQSKDPEVDQDLNHTRYTETITLSVILSFLQHCSRPRDKSRAALSQSTASIDAAREEKLEEEVVGERFGDPGFDWFDGVHGACFGFPVAFCAVVRAATAVGLWSSKGILGVLGLIGVGLIRISVQRCVAKLALEEG